MTDDDLFPQIGHAALGVVTVHTYSADPVRRETRPSSRHREGERRHAPNSWRLARYDGMALIYQALEKNKGATDGDALIAAMKGASWTSPRGPISIDPETRDIVQTISPQGREGRRPALQRRVRLDPRREDPYKASKQ